MSRNPNNCPACGHKDHPDGGWCYMFREEPKEVCMQHTARFKWAPVKWIGSDATPGPKAAARGGA